MGGHRSVGMGCRLRSCSLFVWAEGTRLAVLVPSLPRMGRIGGPNLEVFFNITAYVRVGARVPSLTIAWSYRVIDIVGGLLPRIEHHLFVAMVGVQRYD